MSVPDGMLSAVARWVIDHRLSEGDRLPAQRIADELQVSRTPITSALGQLQVLGAVKREPGRGFTVVPGATEQLERLLSDDRQPTAYTRIIDDLLAGRLSTSVTETQLGTIYELTRSQISGLLVSMAREGLVTRRPGYGWTFSPMLTTPDALYDSYRFRIAFEPEALRQPGYEPRTEALLACREIEQKVLKRGADVLSTQQLYSRGVNFHETVAAGCPNPFFVDSLRRVNALRRLLAYRSMGNRERYQQQAMQHLEIIELVLSRDFAAAAESMHAHLTATLQNHELIRPVLGDRGHEQVEHWSTT